MRKYRVKSKFRFTLFLVITILVFGTVFSTLLGTGTANSVSFDQFKPVKVESGETLWTIAKANNPHNKDIRSVIYEIKELNNLKSGEITVGQKILIPVYN